MGYFETPLECPPHVYWLGDGRYNDPQGEFRTLYCAPAPLTCLREKLAPFRYSLRMREERHRRGLSTSKRISSSWRRDHVLAQGRLLLLKGELIPIFEPGIRSRLEDELRDLLVTLRISRLDLGEVQGNRRSLTQGIARRIFEWEAAGILYQSRYDGQLCCALFEERARLVPVGVSRLLSDSLPEFDQVCEEFRLDVEATVPQPSS